MRLYLIDRVWDHMLRTEQQIGEEEFAFMRRFFNVSYLTKGNVP